MLEGYFAFLRKHKVAVAIPLLLILFIFGPVGYNSTDYVAFELAQEDRGQDQDVLSFTSLTEDLIFVIEGDEHLLSQEVWDWVAAIAFDLQNDPIIQEYAADGVSLQHIFDQGKQLLSPYLTNIFSVTAGINVTTYMLIEGTSFLINTWQNNFQVNTSTAYETTRTSTITNITQKINALALGSLVVGFVEPWINRTMDYWGDTDPVDMDYSTYISAWRDNSTFFLINEIPEQLQSLFQTILTTLDEHTIWDSTTILKLTSAILFGNTDSESLDFLNQIFDQGNNPTKPVQIADENLIAFLRGDYLPIGFPGGIRDFFVESFTNAYDNQVATSMILRMSLREDLTDDEVIIVLEAMVQRAVLFEESNPFGYKIALLSMVNYERERSQSLSEELHQIDLVALGIAFIVLVFFFDNVVLAVLTASLAFGTAQSIKGITILTLGQYYHLDATSVSMASTLILGAAMNYVVFFAFRYRQEIKNGKTHSEAIDIATDKAIHSIAISGIAVALTLLPYLNSSMDVLKDFSRISAFALVIQLVVLIHALPVVFDFLSIVKDLGDYKDISISIKINPSRAKRIITISTIVFILCLIILAILPNSFAATEFIGEEGQTGKALDIVDRTYSENYLSKILIQLEFDDIIRSGDDYDPLILSKIDQLSRDLMNIEEVDSLISIARPIIEKIDVNNESLALVTREAALIIADQLVDETNTITYLIIQLTVSSTSDEVNEPVEELRVITDQFVDNEASVAEVTYTGLPMQTYGFYQHITEEVPIQLIIAIFLLTAFLWWQLGSISVPIRLELTIIFATILSITITSILWLVLTGQSLNAVVIITVLLILLGIGTDFDIYIYRRILEELEAGATPVDAINTAVDKSGVAVIVSGIVMAVTFISLLLSDISFVRQFGFVTFITILMDILLVRTLIVPAILMVFTPHIKESKE